MPTPCRLHIDERCPGLCQGDRRADTQRVSGDEAFDAGCVCPLLDDPTVTHDREAFRGGVSTAACPAEQRSRVNFARFAILIGAFPRVLSRPLDRDRGLDLSDECQPIIEW